MPLLTPYTLSLLCTAGPRWVSTCSNVILFMQISARGLGGVASRQAASAAANNPMNYGCSGVSCLLISQHLFTLLLVVLLKPSVLLMRTLSESIYVEDTKRWNALSEFSPGPCFLCTCQTEVCGRKTSICTEETGTWMSFCALLCNGTAWKLQVSFVDNERSLFSVIPHCKLCNY